MAIDKYTVPLQKDAGSSTFADNLVGFQLVDGGGLTQGNFNFTVSFNEKTNRTFSTGTFSNPISLETMGMESVAAAKQLFEDNFKVYPNFDTTLVTNFTTYGSLSKRFSVSIEKIINYFPAAIEVLNVRTNFSTGETASNISYNTQVNETYLEVDVDWIRNPFDIDYSTRADINLAAREMEVSYLRNLTKEFQKYVISINGTNYPVNSFTPTSSLTSGTLKFYIEGNPFSGQTEYYGNFAIRPSDYYVNKTFNEEFDEVENFLLNRLVTPIYTSTFQVPEQNEDGTYYIFNTKLTWPLDLLWNLDIRTPSFTTYLTDLNEIAVDFDDYRTNVISRFLVTGSLKEFDTEGQKFEKILQVYGRSFDETQKFVNALAYMNSVNYNVANDIPSQLLKNLSLTLGWETNISPISNEDLLTSVFGTPSSQAPIYSGYSISQTPDELNYQFYRNLVLNSAYLFKSKGTRKSIEYLLRLVGAPDSLVEFNEYVYVADQRINIQQFDTQYAQVSGGTYAQKIPVYDPNVTFSIQGQVYSGYTSQTQVTDVNFTRSEYPVDSLGYPQQPTMNDDNFYQKGSGWFESTPKHRSPEEVDSTNSQFTGFNPSYQTQLTPFTYGEDYLNQYRNLPYTNLGFNLTKIVDNKKSWADDNTILRTSSEGNFNARYVTSDDKLVLNVKNVDLMLNPAQGLLYDIYNMSVTYDFPIPNSGLTAPYPVRQAGVDNTQINPQPQNKTFFEFAQIFWRNMINVRNRQYITDGKTSGYPTLSTIYWKYIQSELFTNAPNDHFTYQKMIDYVNGLGDYWIRLVEQMIPATTLWNTGVKLENTVLNRQKFVWRRQLRSQLVAVPCVSCSMNGNLYPTDCPINSVSCGVYPWQKDSSITSFSAVLGRVLNNYLGSTIVNCDLNTLTTDWYVDIEYSGATAVQYLFFSGVGYGAGSTYEGLSFPSSSTWLSALQTTMDTLLEGKGLDYYISADDELVVYSVDCQNNKVGNTFKVNVGININISCS